MSQQETLEKLKCMLVDEGFELEKMGERYYSSDLLLVTTLIGFKDEIDITIKKGCKRIDYPCKAIQDGHIQPIIDWLAAWGVRPG